MRELGVIIAAALAFGSCTTTLVSPSTAALVTDRVGRVSITHPASWALVAGPPPGAFGYVPLGYLSSIPLNVGPCPTPEPSALFDGCPFPVTSLAPNGVVVTIEPNGGLAEESPPAVTTKAAEGTCLAAGGEREVFSVVGGIVLTACLRGPSLDAEEAQVRAAIGSISDAS